MNFEVVVADVDVVVVVGLYNGEAVSKSVSAGGGERAGLGFSRKCSSWPQGVQQLWGTNVLGAHVN